MNTLTERLKKDRNIIGNLSRIAQKYNYSIFYKNNKIPVNLNIWGIRSLNEDTKRYNDSMILFYERSLGDWYINFYDITTDPSEFYLLNPMTKDGTAILAEGQHKALWRQGLHSGYKALVQNRQVRVFRDNNRDTKLDYIKYEYGMFGINCHRASKWSVVDLIGKYSAGCQVHKDVNRYEKEFIDVVCDNLKGGSVSYTLINEMDL